MFNFVKFSCIDAYCRWPAAINAQQSCNYTPNETHKLTISHKITKLNLSTQ